MTQVSLLLNGISFCPTLGRCTSAIDRKKERSAAIVGIADAAKKSYNYNINNSNQFMRDTIQVRLKITYISIAQQTQIRKSNRFLSARRVSHSRNTSTDMQTQTDREMSRHTQTNTQRHQQYQPSIASFWVQALFG